MEGRPPYYYSSQSSLPEKIPTVAAARPPALPTIGRERAGRAALFPYMHSLFTARPYVARLQRWLRPLGLRQVVRGSPCTLLQLHTHALPGRPPDSISRLLPGCCLAVRPPRHWPSRSQSRSDHRPLDVKTSFPSSTSTREDRSSEESLNWVPTIRRTACGVVNMSLLPSGCGAIFANNVPESNWTILILVPAEVITLVFSINRMRLPSG